MDTLKFLKKEDSLPWLSERIILLCKTGSTMYGTNLTKEEDPQGRGSDTDYRGICIPPKEYYFGMHKFSSFDNTGGKNFKTTCDMTDVSISHITKFTMDAMKGVPNNVEILFLNKENYDVLNDFGLELLKKRFDFLSKDAIKAKFSGYATAQKHKMVNKTTRKDLVDMFGYDTKFASHSCRLMLMAVEILSTGDLRIPLNNAHWLSSIRKGKYSLDQILKIIDSLEKGVERAYEKSELPSTPDFNKINNWLISINEKAMEEWR